MDGFGLFLENSEESGCTATFFFQDSSKNKDPTKIYLVFVTVCQGSFICWH